MIPLFLSSIAGKDDTANAGGAVWSDYCHHEK